MRKELAHNDSVVPLVSAVSSRRSIATEDTGNLIITLHSEVMWEMWIIYDRPHDYLNWAVAKQWHYDTDQPRPTGQFVVAATIEGLRQQLTEAGFACLPREPIDDPDIVESWI